MKKIQILLLLLVTSVAVALAGCVNNDNVDETVPAIADAPTETEPTSEPTAYEPEAYEPATAYIAYEPDEEPYEYVQDEPTYDDPTYEDPTPAQAAAAPAGFVRYDSENYGFSIYHPEHWISSSGALALMVDVAARELLADSMGQAAVDLLLGQDIDGTMVSAQWFDPAGITGLFMANTNIVVSPGAGLSQALIQDDAIKAMFTALYDEMFGEIFDAFERTSDIQGEVLGDNYFKFFSSDVAMMGIETSFLQFFTVIGNYSYTITFSASRGQIDLELAKSIAATLDA